METIGNLVDKLTIVNMRIWILEDIKRDSHDDRVVAEATRKTNLLNQQRGDLIQEIDEFIIALVAGTVKMKSYGQGSTKVYGKS